MRREAASLRGEIDVLRAALDAERLRSTVPINPPPASSSAADAEMSPTALVTGSAAVARALEQVDIAEVLTGAKRKIRKMQSPRRLPIGTRQQPDALVEEADENEAAVDETAEADAMLGRLANSPEGSPLLRLLSASARAVR